MTATRRQSGTALLWIFSASGFAGLIYESIWTHYLGLILGHSAYAQVLVLALFMGGMALGAWLISRRSELLMRPLAVYAGIELTLGIFGVCFHPYYQFVSELAYETLFPALEPGASLEIARWLVASALILPQCVLLGMTFPLMSAGYIRRTPNTGGQVLAGLYFSNSLGAAVGAIVATFVLLPTMGLPGTVLTAGLVNILVALAVWPIAKTDSSVAPVVQHKVERRQEQSAPLFILAVAAITGASSFVYEVSWVRMLAMVLGSTIHAFELMLAAFIAGIAFGGLWLRKRADGFSSPRIAAGWAQIAMGCFALSTLFLYNQSFSWVAWAIRTLNRTSESAYTLYNVASAVISMIIMFPTAFFAGMTLPLLTLTLLKDGAGESAIGRTYAANTLGAIFGVGAAVFVGLPLLGLRLSLWTAAAADIVVGLLLLVAIGPLRAGIVARIGWKVPVGAGLAGLLLMAAFGLTRFDPYLMSSTVFRFGDYRVPEDLKMYFHKDGRTASVTLRDVRDGQRSIFTNGKPDASISFDNQRASDEMTMTVAGIAPMLYRPQARTAAIIGFGSGMTTHTVLGNPGMDSVDTIEIEPAMIEAAQHFRPIVERAFSDPRSHIIIDDAKSYFATSRKRYDIIISEPSNPWVNGVASLFTEEFYTFIPKHLSEAGVFAQWIQAYEITPAQINSIINAMAPHFGDIRIFAAGDTDWILVASPSKPLGNSTFAIPGTWSPALRGEVEKQGIGSAEDISLLYNGDKKLLQTYSTLYPGSGVNSDFFPILQLGTAKSRFMNAQGIELLRLRMTNWPIFEVLTNTPPPPSDLPLQHALVSRNPVAATTLKAKAIQASILAGPAVASSASLHLEERLAINYLRSAATTCRFDRPDKDSFIVLTSLAELTIPYLSLQESRHLWQDRRWLKCQPKDPLILKYLDFIDAVATRNHTKVVEQGIALLGTDDSFSEIRRIGAVRNYLVGATQTSAYALEDYATVVNLERSFGPLLHNDFARLFLVQSARNKLR